MVDFMIALCTKAIVGTLVKDVNEKIDKIPLKLTEQMLAGWNKDGGLPLEKWIRAGEAAADAKAAVDSALNSWKDKTGLDWTWDMVSAVVEVGKSMSDIVDKPEFEEPQARSNKAQPDMRRFTSMNIGALPGEQKPTQKRPASVQKRRNPKPLPPARLMTSKKKGQFQDKD